MAKRKSNGLPVEEEVGFWLCFLLFMAILLFAMLTK